MEEWKVWLVIYGFLAFIISLALWLVFRVYPSAIMRIYPNEISLEFKRNGWFGSSFNLAISDIISLTRHELAGDAYYRFKTRHPSRKFQVSLAAKSFEEEVALDEVMIEMSKRVNTN